MSATTRAPAPELYLTRLGRVPYLVCWRAMQRFTDERTAATADALWLVEHPPVFTQGQAGRAEHLLDPGDIPVVQTDRGGQITYHGPGQIIAYVLVDLRRRKLGVRRLVGALEGAVIDLLAGFGISAGARADAPGVYVDGAKIASVGLRVRHGCSYHGIALNVDLDLAPFRRINPCGYEGLPMTRVVDLLAPAALAVEALDEPFALAIADRLDLRLTTAATTDAPPAPGRSAGSTPVA